MIKNLPMDELFPLIKEALLKGSEFSFIPNGTSMLPLIRGGVDTVRLSKLPDTVRIGDIILYCRPSGQKVMHRVIGKTGSGYIFCGDNQSAAERGVTREDMAAIVTHITRDGKTVDLENDRDYLRYKKRTVHKKRILCRITEIKRATKKLLHL